MANLGVKPAEVLATLNGQNKTTYTGYYENGENRIAGHCKLIKYKNGDMSMDYLSHNVSEKAKGIEHIPKVLYHWRVHKASTADNPLSKKYAYDAGKRAVTEHIRRCGEEAEVTDTLFPGFYRAKYQVTGEPLVSIIIPNKDEKETLKKCLDSIKEKSTYRNYEMVLPAGDLFLDVVQRAFFQPADLRLADADGLRHLHLCLAG